MSATDRRDHIDAAAPGEVLADVLRKVARKLALEINVSIPATVIAYNPATQRASVLLATVPVLDDIVDVPQPSVTLPSVPVAFPRACAGTCYDTWPVMSGDTGHVVFCDRALDNWFRLGGAVDPTDARTHSLSDGVFYLGVSPDSRALPATDPTARVVEHAALIKLGRNAVEPVIKATTFIAAMDAAIQAAVVAGTGAPGTTGTLAFLAFQTAWNAVKANLPTIKTRVE